MLKIVYFGINLQNRRVIVTEKIELGNGRFMLLFGDNSTGKSLFLKAINGDFRNYEGEILIKEKPPIFYRKRRKSILLESTAHILEQETVWKNILLPIPKLSNRIKQNIIDFLSIAGLNNLKDHKARNLSYSQKKFIEIIRAAIQIPYLILLDDLDGYFDASNHDKAMQILQYATNNGCSVIATSKTRIEGFDEYYRIQNKKVVQL